MARFLVELLINAAGEPEVRAVFDNIGAAAGRSSKAVDSANLRTESALRRTAEAAAKLKEQMSETGKSKSFISDMEQLNKKLKEQAEHWKRGEAGIAAWAEKEKAAAEAQRILTAQVRAGVAADSEHGKRIAELIRQHNIYQKELDETKRKELERRNLLPKPGGSGMTVKDQQLALLGGISGLTGGGGPVLQGAQTLLYFRSALDSVNEGAKDTGLGLAGVAKSLGPLAAGLGIAAAGALVFVAAFKTITAVAGYFADVIAEGTETQVMIEQLNSTLRSNGSYSGLSARGMIDLAESLALLSGGMDDPIIKAETIASRFDRIGSDIFPRVITAAVNMSRALGKSVEESAESISRLLSGTQGLRGAREAGIILDPAQKKYLENLIEQNKLTEYQNTLLDILEQKLGNAAEAFGNTLPGAVGRARFVYGEFREEIANQVIPALEDVLSTLIDFAGGWDVILRAAKMAGTEIGDAVRKMVYAIAISYHEWQASTDGLAAHILGVFKSIVDGISEFAGAMAEIPGPQSLAFRAVQVETGKAAASLAKSQADARKSALDHAGAVARLTLGLAQHRTALDGDTKAYAAHGVEIDRVNKKNAEQARLAQQLAQIQQEQMERTRHLMELDKLASTRGLKEGERIVLEARINREHEYRVDLLKKQAQFGKEIGKALADQERALDDLERNVKVKLEVALIPEISMDSTIVKQFDQSMKEFLVTFRASEELARANAAAYAAVGIAHEEWLADFTDSWRESWKSVRDRAEEEIRAIEDAVALGVESGGMSVIEGERAIAQVRSELIQQQISEWGSLFSTLGSMFGGFFQQLANAISNIQQAYQAGSQIGGMLSQAGMASAATGSALGYMGATVAIMYEIKKYVDAQIKKDRARTWGDTTSVSVTGGVMSSPSYFDQRGREFSLALRDLIDEIEAALGAILDDLPKIVIRARKDGKEFSAYVAGVWVGTFRDAQAAMEAGVAAAITQADFSSISQEFATALKASVGLTLDEIERNIETARSARRARLGDTGEQYVDRSDQWRREIEAARELGLATEDMIDARHRELDAIKYAALGIDTSISDKLRDLGSLSKGIAEAATSTRTALQQQIDAILAEIDRLTRPQGPQSGSGVGGGGGKSGTYSPSSAESDEVRRLREEVARLIDELERIPEALSPEELRMGIFDALYKPFEGTQNKYSEEAKKWAKMRVEIEYELVRLELIRLGMWEEFAQMFNDSLAKARELAGQSVSGGGGRGRGRAQTREELRDEIAGLRADAAGPLHTALFDVQQGIEDFSKRAREAKLPAKELAEGVALMTEQFRRSVREQAEGFAGIGTDFTNRLNSVLDFFAEARALGPGQTGLSEEALAGFEQSSLAQFGSELANAIAQFGGLVDPMRTINRQADELRENILAYGRAAGWSAEQIAAAQDQISAGVEFQREQAINGILGTLFGYLEKDAQYQAQYVEFKRAEIDLQFRLIEAQLRALSMWDEATQRIFNAARAAAEAQITAASPATAIDTSYESTTSSGIDVFEDLEQAKERILDQLAAWNRVPLGELTQQASEMISSFDKLMIDVEKLKPTGWDFTGLAHEAFENAKKGFISGIFESIEDEVEGSPLVRRLGEIGTRFDDIYAALTKIGASQADLEKSELLRLKHVQAALDEWLAPIRGYLDESRFGAASSLTGEQQFKAAQEDFRKYAQMSPEELLKLSPEELVRIGERYKDLGRGFTAGEGYRFIEKEIGDFFKNLGTIVPGLAGDLAKSTNPLGTASNPMKVDVSGMVASLTSVESAVNNGSALMLTEMRASLVEMRAQTLELRGISETLAHQLSVKLVA